MKPALTGIFMQEIATSSAALAPRICALTSSADPQLIYQRHARAAGSHIRAERKESAFLGASLVSFESRQRNLQRTHRQGLSIRAEIMEAEGFTSRSGVPKRKVIEHVVLFKMRDEFDEYQEKDMLDHLYSLQYHYKHIIAISLGRLEKAAKGFTHALLVRFPTLEALRGYLIHPSHSAVLDQFVTPYCEDTLAVDFESEVEEDIEAIFRRGDFFEQGVEHLVLLKVKEGTSPETSAELLTALMELPEKIGPSVVQLTAGQNFSGRSHGFTHGLVVRVPSEEDLQAYNRHPVHREVLRRKILPISEEMLVADYKVDPIGTSLM